MRNPIHQTALLQTLRTVLSHIPHRPYCATAVFHLPKCTCDVDMRVGIAYSVIAGLLIDLGKGTR